MGLIPPVRLVLRPKRRRIPYQPGNSVRLGLRLRGRKPAPVNAHQPMQRPIVRFHHLLPPQMPARSGRTLLGKVPVMDILPARPKLDRRHLPDQRRILRPGCRTYQPSPQDGQP